MRRDADAEAAESGTTIAPLNVPTADSSAVRVMRVMSIKYYKEALL
jgi:hypothetical protein